MRFNLRILTATLLVLFACTTQADRRMLLLASKKVAAGGGGGPTFPAGAVAYWKMDESSGDMAPAIGSAASCTLTNMSTVGFTTGKINNGPNLVAASFDYFQTATNSTELDLGGTDYSLTCWVNITAASLDVFDFIVAKESAPGTDATFYLRCGGDTNLAWQHFPTGAPDIYYAPVQSCLPNTWNFFAVTYDGSNVRLYTNAVLATTTAQTSDIRVLNTNPMTVGYDIGVGLPLGGIVDELGIWKRALSGSEITDLYNGGAGLQP